MKATETALGLAVDFSLSVQARGDGSAQNASNGADPRPSSPNGAKITGRADDSSTPEAAGPRSFFDPRSLAIGAGAAWMLLASVRAIRGIGTRRGRWRV